MITFNLLNQAAMRKAQADYDNQLPPEDHDCKEDGHEWRWLAGVAKDGTRFMRCIKCGEKAEV